MEKYTSGYQREGEELDPYSPKAIRALFLGHLCAIAGFIISWLFVAPFFGESNSMNVYLAFSMVLWFLTGQAFGSLIHMNGGPWRRWHGCEHKTAKLLQRQKPCTLEELRKCGRVHSRCGTRFGTWYFVSPLVLTLLFVAFLGNFTPAFWGWAVFAILWQLNTRFMVVPDPVSLLIQHVWTAREPTDEELQEGLKVAREITSACQSDDGITFVGF